MFAILNTCVLSVCLLCMHKCVGNQTEACLCRLGCWELLMFFFSGNIWKQNLRSFFGERTLRSFSASCTLPSDNSSWISRSVEIVPQWASSGQVQSKQKLLLIEHLVSSMMLNVFHLVSEIIYYLYSNLHFTCASIKACKRFSKLHKDITSTMSSEIYKHDWSFLFFFKFLAVTYCIGFEYWTQVPIEIKLY